jgi:hypothetical protein
MTTSAVQPSGERVVSARPAWPDATGHFGIFGGRFVPEALIAALDEIAAAYEAMRVDPDFIAELSRLQREYSGRPTPVTAVPKFAEHAGGATVLLKREDLNHTGSHKINNVLGQALLVRKLGKTRVIAETGAGQHGVATATAAALMGLSCTVYMGGRTPAGRRSTSPGCGCWEPRSSRSPPAPAHSRTRSTRRSVTGWPTSRARTTSSAPSPGHIRSRAWSVTSSG